MNTYQSRDGFNIKSEVIHDVVFDIIHVSGGVMADVLDRC